MANSNGWQAHVATSPNDGPPVAQVMEEGRAAPAGLAPEFHDQLAGGLVRGPPGRADYRPPEGKWKDAWWQCFNQCAPTCMVSWFLPCCAVAMLAKRVGYQSYGKVFWTLMVAWILAVGVPIAAVYNPDVPMLAFAGNICQHVFNIIALVFVFQLLRHVRQRFRLPSICGNQGQSTCDDCLTTFCCWPCVVSQMLRHTMDYSKRCDGCRIPASGVETLPAPVPQAHLGIRY